MELSALKLNGFIFGETTPLFPFLPSFSLGSTLGEKNLLLGSKFFPLRVDPPFFLFERAALC